jgi:hypothetical protein
MAAYGLYSHIQSNRRRSVVLIAGLFALVYVMVFAGALVAEACGGRRFDDHDAPRLQRRHQPPPRSPPSLRRHGSASPIISTSR